MKPVALWQMPLFAVTFLLSLLSCIRQPDEPDNGVVTPVPEETMPVDGGVITTKPVTLYGKKLMYYAQVNKAGTYFRRMLIDSVSARQFTQTGILPEGSLLILETWFGNSQSTVYVRQKVKGEWLSSSFDPTRPSYETVLTASCNNCHSAARTTDDAFTYPLLRKALSRQVVQTIVCNQPSFTPCDLSVYQGN